MGFTSFAFSAFEPRQLLLCHIAHNTGRCRVCCVLYSTRAGKSARFFLLDCGISDTGIPRRLLSFCPEHVLAREHFHKKRQLFVGRITA